MLLLLLLLLLLSRRLLLPNSAPAPDLFPPSSWHQQLQNGVYFPRSSSSHLSTSRSALAYPPLPCCSCRTPFAAQEATPSASNLGVISLWPVGRLQQHAGAMLDWAACEVFQTKCCCRSWNALTQLHSSDWAPAASSCTSWRATSRFGNNSPLMHSHLALISAPIGGRHGSARRRALQGVFARGRRRRRR